MFGSALFPRNSTRITQCVLGFPSASSKVRDKLNPMESRTTELSSHYLNDPALDKIRGTFEYRARKSFARHPYALRQKRNSKSPLLRGITGSRNGRTMLHAGGILTSKIGEEGTRLASSENSVRTCLKKTGLYFEAQVPQIVIAFQKPPGRFHPATRVPGCQSPKSILQAMSGDSFKRRMPPSFATIFISTAVSSGLMACI